MQMCWTLQEHWSTHFYSPLVACSDCFYTNFKAIHIYTTSAHLASMLYRIYSTLFWLVESHVTRNKVKFCSKDQIVTALRYGQRAQTLADYWGLIYAKVHCFRSLDMDKECNHWYIMHDSGGPTVAGRNNGAMIENDSLWSVHRWVIGS